MKKKMIFLVMVGFVAAFSAVVNAETVCNDDLGDGLRGRTGSLDLNWWQVNNSSNYNLTVADDTGGIGTGNALFLENLSGATTRRLVANFPRTVQLAASGDYIELNFDLRLTSAVPVVTSNGLRFGLYDSVGTFATEDIGSDDTLVDDDLGYMFRIATNGGGSELRLERDRGLGALLGGSDPVLITTDLVYGSIAGTTKHDFKFIITVIDTPSLGMQWDLYIDDDAKVSPALSGVSYILSLDDEYTKFDEVAFAAYGSGIDFAIDNVEVISNSVLDNTPPSVDAGGHAIVPLLTKHSLSGSYTDDGIPGGLGDDTYKWSAVNDWQDPNMIFTDPGDWVLDPNVTILHPGMYPLKLEVNDGYGVIGVDDPNTNGTGSDNFYAHAKEASKFDALQGRWKFDGISSDADDYYYNYTTIEGAPAFNEIDEKIGVKCLSLAPGDEIRYGWALGAEDSVSVAFWMKPDAAALADTAKGIVSKYPDTGTSKFGGWTVQWRDQNTMRFRVNDSWGNGNGDLIVTDPNGFRFNEWVHVAATFDGDTGEQKFYRNGILVAEGDSPHTSFDPHAEFKIGTLNWAGMIDDMYLYDYAIDLIKVRELYTLGGNAAPAVTADDLLVKGTVNVGIALTSSFVDENAAMNSASWVKVDGPGNMVLTNIVITGPTDGVGTVTATATFDAVGDYTLQATVTDDGIPAPSMTGVSDEFVVKVRTASFDGLEAHFDFNSGLSSTAGEVTYTGTAVGSAVQTAGAGISGSGGLVLDGTTGHLDFNKYLGAEDAITVMLWYKTDVIAAAQRMVQKWSADLTGRGWALRLRLDAPYNDSGLIGSAFNGYQVEVRSPDAIGFPVSTWTHVAMTFDGATAKLYHNGVYVDNDEDALDFSTDDIVTALVMGYRSNNGSEFFDGAIDEVRIYDYALTYTEVYSIYTSDGGAAPTTCISAAIPGDFNDDCYVDLVDFSIIGAAWLSTTVDLNWNGACDIAPMVVGGANGDDVIDVMDLAAQAQDWLSCVDPADVDCL